MKNANYLQFSLEDMRKTKDDVVISDDEVAFTDAGKVAVLRSESTDNYESFYRMTEAARASVSSIEPIVIVDHDGTLLAVSEDEFKEFDYREVALKRYGEIGEFNGKWVPICYPVQHL